MAYESSAFGRSYLGEYMVHRAMVLGAAADTVQTAPSWAHAKISQEYPGREPVQYDNSDGAVSLRPRTGQASPGGSQPPAEPTPAEQPPSPAPEPAPPPRNCRGLICFG